MYKSNTGMSYKPLEYTEWIILVLFINLKAFNKPILLIYLYDNANILNDLSTAILHPSSASRKTGKEAVAIQQVD